VDSEKGIVHYLVNVPGWKQVYLRRILQRKLNLPCFIDNDANAMALGEFCYGAGKGSRNMVCVTLGTGVGGGIIINKKIYRGSSSLAGEIGHIPINEKGPLCNCQGKACIERYVGNRYIIQELKRRMRSGEKTSALRLAGGKVSMITPETLAKAARSGDRLSKDIWEQVGRRLGVMLSGIINVLNPDRIVIGGGIAKAGNLIFVPMRKTILKRAMYVHARDCKVTAAKLGTEAGAIGAAALVWQA
jgi:glucokinase